MKVRNKISSILIAVVFMITAFLMPVRAEIQKKNIGNFVWIWQVQNDVNNHGGINGLIAYLKSLNVNNICIKYHEGAGTSGGQTDFREDFYKYKDAFKRAGFTVGTWGYNYFNHPQEESNLIIEALKNSDYYVYDPEIDVANKATQTEEVCKAVREACPDGLIGYASFPIVHYHENINYAAFNKYCDFAAPQIYWDDMGWNVNHAIDATLKDHKAFGLDKPIYPTIQGYNTSLADYNTFKSYGFESYSIWSLDSLDDNGAKFISSNSNATVSIPASNPQPQEYNYSPNAVVQGDWLYTRLRNGSVEQGHRVDIGDRIQVLDVSYSRQLTLVKYPTSYGLREAYVKNCNLIKYNGDSWQNGHTPELVYDKPNGNVIGKLNPWEKATKLNMEDGYTNVVYNTVKGSNTKSGYVRYAGR